MPDFAAPPSPRGRPFDIPAPGDARLLITRAEVRGRLCDVRVHGGLIAQVAPRLPALSGEEMIDARGAALLPGLHDHHIHLLALAAAADSVHCGPPQVSSPDLLRSALRTASARLPPGAWLRGTGYHESVAGPIDRADLDAMVADRPVRIQHRGGALWILNSRALDALGPSLDDTSDVERDRDGAPTGRLFRYDARLRAAIGADVPDLGAAGARLARLGVTGVTDATPDLDPSGQRLLGAAVADGRLALRVQLLGYRLGDRPAAGLPAGPRKLLLRDHDLPGLDELTDAITVSHAAGRAVAVHCVTRESLLLTLAAIERAGSISGDRVEHAAVVPPQVRDWIRRLGLRVVTQPCFIADRGDDYLNDVEAEDHPNLYPYATLLEAGVRVAPSSDAPFGDPDPWRGMASAVARATRSGRTLGAHERVRAAAVLDGYLAPLDDPGGRPRRVAAGRPADLCLLSEPLDAALSAPTSESVRLVVSGGRLVYRR